MSTTTDPQGGTFRLSMLLNDTRYRSATLQALAAIILALAIWYLGRNLSLNLQAAGLNISYEFLGAPSGYDINQTLVSIHRVFAHLFVGLRLTYIRTGHQHPLGPFNELALR